MTYVRGICGSEIMDTIEIKGTTDYDGTYKRKGQVMTLLKGKAKLLTKIEGLKSDNDKLRNSINDMLIQNKRLVRESDLDQRDTVLAIEEAKSEIRKEMQKDLVMADVKLAGARGKLEAYDKLMIDRQEFMTLIKEVLMALKDRPDIKVLKAE